MEAYLVELFEDAIDVLFIHTKCATIMPMDLRLSHSLCHDANMYNYLENVTGNCAGELNMGRVIRNIIVLGVVCLVSIYIIFGSI